MKTIIAGSRQFNGVDLTYNLVNNIINKVEFDITEVVSGNAKGIDRLGELWARINKIPVKLFIPAWSDISAPNAIIKTGPYGEYNARAGFDRNEQMAIYADCLIAIWNGKSKGTLNMIELMNTLDKPLHVEIIDCAIAKVEPISDTSTNTGNYKYLLKKYKLKKLKEGDKLKRKICF